jgi:hypothetical protein
MRPLNHFQSAGHGMDHSWGSSISNTMSRWDFMAIEVCEIPLRILVQLFWAYFVRFFLIWSTLSLLLLIATYLGSVVRILTPYICGAILVTSRFYRATFLSALFIFNMVFFTKLTAALVVTAISMRLLLYCMYLFTGRRFGLFVQLG